MAASCFCPPNQCSSISLLPPVVTAQLELRVPVPRLLDLLAEVLWGTRRDLRSMICESMDFSRADDAQPHLQECDPKTSHRPTQTSPENWPSTSAAPSQPLSMLSSFGNTMKTRTRTAHACPRSSWQPGIGSQEVTASSCQGRLSLRQRQRGPRPLLASTLGSPRELEG